MSASRTLAQGALAFAVLCSAGLALRAQEASEGALPPAQTDGGKPLMQALKDRQTLRSFADRPLPRQMLSNLLWAAAGINRPASGGRTAPTAHNAQEIDVYVALPEGLYLYEPRRHGLARVTASDLRSSTGTQPHAREAPLTLVYVADESHLQRDDEATRRFYGATDTGFVAQNVYLFCASEGLATVVFASIDRERLARAMNLRPSQRIVLAQSVGFSKESAR